VAESYRIVRAWLESPTAGIIELDRDWAARGEPRFTLGPHGPTPRALAPAPGLPMGRAYGYFLNKLDGEILFVLPLEHGCDIDPVRDSVYLAGDFNGWEAAVGQENWRLQPAELEGGRALVWGEVTVFRIFAPRARAVSLWIASKPSFAADALREAKSFSLARRNDADGAAGVWEVTLDLNLHGWFYWYALTGAGAGPSPD